MSALPESGRLIMPGEAAVEGAVADRGLVTFVHADAQGVDSLSTAAVQALIESSVVLAGDEIDESLLRLVPAQARIVQLGRPGGRQAAPRSFVNRLMLIAALEGERVVHLLTGGEAPQQLRDAMPVLRAAGIAIRIIELPAVTGGRSAVPGAEATRVAGPAAGQRAGWEVESGAPIGGKR